MCESIGILASGVFEDLNSPATTSVVAISGWLISNVGRLNTLLNTNYEVISGCIAPELGLEEQAIYREVFTVKYYDRQVQANLGAAAYDASIVQVTEGNRTIRITDRNELAKSFVSLRRDAQGTLSDLIALYKINRSQARQVTDDCDDEMLGTNPRLAGNYYRGYYDLD